MNLGFLEFGALLPNKSTNEIINNTIEYAKLADTKGFSRFWLTEHHSEFVAWAGPEIMIGLIANATKKIRVGAAGILLNLYSSYKVAENFNLLESIAPGRIDLGLGKGVAPEQKHYELTGKENSDYSVEHFNDKVKLLLKYHSQKNTDSSLRLPNINCPDVWVLGSRLRSAELAAATGTAFGFSGFMKSKPADSDALKFYKENFSPSEFLQQPKYNITVAGVCAEDEERAKDLAVIFPNKSIDVSVIGTPEICAEKLHEIKEKFQCNEIIFIDATLKHEDRIRTIELLSEIIP